MGYLPTDCQEEEKRSESGKLNKSGAEKKCEGCRVEILPFRENQRREKMGHPFVSRGLGKTKARGTRPRKSRQENNNYMFVFSESRCAAQRDRKSDDLR